jgi:hypothetical protein
MSSGGSDVGSSAKYAKVENSTDWSEIRMRVPTSPASSTASSLRLILYQVSFMSLEFMKLHTEYMSVLIEVTRDSNSRAVLVLAH